MAKNSAVQPIIIRKKKVAHAHHGGAWKVNQSSDVKSAIAGYFQDPRGKADEFGSSILPGEGVQSQTIRNLGQTTPEGLKVLAMLGEELGLLDLPLRVEGHSDAHSFKVTTPYTNWELSADRANAARRTLVQSGVAGTNVDEVRAMADRELKVPDNPYSPRNRRVAIMMLLQREDDGS